MRHSINHAGMGNIVAESVTAGALIGPLTGDTTGTHYGPVGNEAGRTSPAVPANDTAFQAATGLSAAWWDFSALSGAGSVASKGAVAGTLATSGTLAYGYTLGGQVGVHFDSSTGDFDFAAADDGDDDEETVAYSSNGKRRRGNDSHRVAGRY